MPSRKHYGFDNSFEAKEVVVFDYEFCEDYLERVRNDQNALRQLLCSEATVQVKHEETNPVLAIYKKIDSDTDKICCSQYKFETFNKNNSSNIPIVAHCVVYVGDRFFLFRTKRRNEIIQDDFLLKKFQPKFYDEKDERSDEYCLEIYVDKNLANPGKLQQEFSMFLASGKHLVEFLFDTIWPHIDASVEKEKQQKIEEMRRIDQASYRRENHPRYSLRARRNDGESCQENDRENQQ